MRRSSLGARLGQVRKMKQQKDATREERALQIEGWDNPAPYVFHRKLTAPLRWSKPLFSDSLVLAAEAETPENLVFWDTETTGLSGGAGNIAFLIGWARKQDDCLELEQLFLADYPGEQDFLMFFRNRLGSGDVLVSYNGRSFDWPLIQGRFYMKLLTPPEIKQLDLLTWSRRFWRDLLPSCSLSSVEEHILGCQRELDIPGREIPDMYFRFLKAGKPDHDLLRVFAHHKQDIISLSDLYGVLEEIMQEKRSDIAFDRARAGMALVRDCPDPGRRWLETASEEGDARATLYLAWELKRKGEWQKAVSLWEHQMALKPDWKTAVELAKYHEHQSGCMEKALVRARQAGDLYPGESPGILAALAHRLKRLENK